MRALLCTRHGPVDEVEVCDAPDAPLPGPHEVCLALDYASVSHATKLLIEGTYQSKPPLPFIPGTEAVGRVVACGAGVTRLRVGDRVAALARWGCFAERLTLPEYTVYPIPDALSDLAALPVPLSFGTAYAALKWRAALQPAETVLVLGAGSGVGLAAVEIASLMGASVLACASTEEKRQAALQGGATHAFAADEQLARTVKELTHGKGVDVVFDAVGGDGFERSVRAAASNARLLSIGFASGRVPQVALNHLLVKNLTLHAFFYGRYIGWTPVDERVTHAQAMQQMMAELFDWACTKQIRPVVTAVYPIAGLATAIAALESRQVVGKVALKIKSETPSCTSLHAPPVAGLLDSP